MTQIAVGKMKLVSVVKQRKRNRSRPLRNLLRELDVLVLEPNSLEAYRQSKVASHQERFATVEKKSWWFNTTCLLLASITYALANLVMLCGVISVICSVVNLALLLGSLTFGNSELFATSASWLPIFVRVASACCFGLYGLMHLDSKLRGRLAIWGENLQKIAEKHPKIRWATIPLAHYNNLDNAPKVPQNVLVLIRTIKAELASVEVSIEYTMPFAIVRVCDQATINYLIDPIVWVEYRGERFPISVFDETGAEIPYVYL